MRETMLTWDFIDKEVCVEGNTHNLRGLGNQLMIVAVFTTLNAKLIFKF